MLLSFNPLCIITSSQEYTIEIISTRPIYALGTES